MGREIPIDDPESGLLTKLATMGGNNPRALLRHEVFTELRLIPGFTERFGEMIADIDQHGVIPTLRRALRDDARELVS
jgi:mannitol 2-dehydrogenase